MEGMINVGYAEKPVTAAGNIYQTINQTGQAADFAEPAEIKTLRLRRMKFLFAHNPEHLIQSGLISSLEELEFEAAND